MLSRVERIDKTADSVYTKRDSFFLEADVMNFRKKEKRGVRVKEV